MFPLPTITITLLLSLLSLSPSSLIEAAPSRPPSSLPQSIEKEIAGYQDVVEKIVDYVMNGPGQNQSYDRLAKFTDAFGSRLAGVYMHIVTMYVRSL